MTKMSLLLANLNTSSTLTAVLFGSAKAYTPKHGFKGNVGVGSPISG